MQSREAFSILLVDDDPTVVRVLSRMLSAFEPLRFATSGRHALKLAHESIPDLIMLDVEMPDLGGFEVCRALKSDAVLAEVPVVFLTSHESAELEAVGLQLGAADFISKPPHAPLVLARVRTYQQIKQLSDTVRSAVKIDFLTGTLTRRQLEKALAHEWLRAARMGSPLAFALADIEGFGRYNAQFGEEQGDRCLKALAQALGSLSRGCGNVLGRYAGGKFGLVLPETDEDGAHRIAQQVLDAAQDVYVPGVAGGSGERIELSLGVGCCTATAAAIDEVGANPHTAAQPDAALAARLIVVAERALREARACGAGRARITVDGRDTRA